METIIAIILLVVFGPYVFVFACRIAFVATLAVALPFVYAYGAIDRLIRAIQERLYV